MLAPWSHVSAGVVVGHLRHAGCFRHALLMYASRSLLASCGHQSLTHSIQTPTPNNRLPAHSPCRPAPAFVIFSYFRFKRLQDRNFRLVLFMCISDFCANIFYLPGNLHGDQPACWIQGMVSVEALSNTTLRWPGKPRRRRSPPSQSSPTATNTGNAFLRRRLGPLDRDHRLDVVCGSEGRPKPKAGGGGGIQQDLAPPSAGLRLPGAQLRLGPRRPGHVATSDDSLLRRLG